MRTRLFEGVVYVKASELARQYHYTADYLGQLARQEKVKARLAAGSWYIEEASLLAYRKRDGEPAAKAGLSASATRARLKNRKRAVSPVPKRQRVTKSSESKPSAHKPAAKIKATSRALNKRTEAAVVEVPVEREEPRLAPQQPEPGLWQRATGWLKKLKGK